MNVLLITQYFWPETFGINALVGALCCRNVRFTVLTGQPNYPEGQVFSGYSAWKIQCENFQGAEIIRLPIFPRGKRSALRLALNYLSFVFSAYVLGPWLLRWRRFDVVVVYAPSPLLQTLPAIWIAWIKRAPLAVWVQDLWPESLSATGFIKNRIVLNWVSQIVRFIYRNVDRILVPSRAFYEPIEALGVNSKRIFYYPNAFVEEPVSGEQPVVVQSLADDISAGFSIVFAGNLGTAQSLETIIDAADRVQTAATDIRFFLIGSGSRSDWLEAEVERRGLVNVVLPGRFPASAMPSFYSAASALLVSLRDEPIFALTIPSKVQSYLAAGKPILASLNGEGARVVVEAGAGIVSKAGDSGALADAVLTLSRLGADRCAEMGENARRYAIDNFSLDRLAADLESQFEEMLAVRREKPR